MLFSATRYPILRDIPRQERLPLVSAALRRHDPRARWRFWIALASCIAAGVTLSGFVGGPADLPVLAGALAAGLLFYAYLLWEINGPVLAAVTRYMNEER